MPVTTTPLPKTTVAPVATVTVPVEKAELPVIVSVLALQFTAPLRVEKPSDRLPVLENVTPPDRVPEATDTVPPALVITEFTPVVVAPAVNAVVAPVSDRKALVPNTVAVDVRVNAPLTASVAAAADTVSEGIDNDALSNSVPVPADGPTSGTASELVLNVPAPITSAPVEVYVKAKADVIVPVELTVTVFPSGMASVPPFKVTVPLAPLISRLPLSDEDVSVMVIALAEVEPIVPRRLAAPDRVKAPADVMRAAPAPMVVPPDTTKPPAAATLVVRVPLAIDRELH